MQLCGVAEHADGLICVMELMLKGCNTAQNQMQFICVANLLCDAVVTFRLIVQIDS